jgi:uncharacterized protein
MIRHLFVKKLQLPRPAHEVFAWHEEPGALEKLVPPTDPMRIAEHTAGLQGPLGDGARLVLELGRGPFKLRWVAEHEGYIKDRQFVDVQTHGPFAFWRHTHLFTPRGERASVLEDRVEYALPLHMVGDLVAHDMVRAKISRMFEWRHRATFDALVRPEFALLP